MARRKSRARKKSVKVFVIPDTHFPFHNEQALKDVLALIKKEKPTHVVQLGDLLDQYVFSKYTRSPEITPEAEITEGLALATKMWQDIKKAVPNAKCYQLMGNHDVRLSKRISEKIPELASFFNVKDLYKFKGVKVLGSDRDFLEIDKVIYVHGYLSKSIDHAKHFNKPTVHGHRHRPCIEVDGTIWSMDCGFLADETSLPLQYTMSKVTKWHMACGIVEDRKPRLVLL